jgi:hypothetical protein
VGPTDDRFNRARGRASRRLFLAAIAATASTALAGCGGNAGGDGDDESETTTDGSGGTTAGAESTERTTATEGADSTDPTMTPSDTTEPSVGCPSLPQSSVRAKLPGPPAVTFEVPTLAEVTVIGSQTDGVFGGRIAVPRVAASGDWVVDVTGNRQEEATIAAALANEPELSEVTGEYDLAVQGARAFEPPERDVLVVFLPTTGRPLRAKVTASPSADEVRCADAAALVIERVVETLRPAE